MSDEGFGAVDQVLREVKTQLQRHRDELRYQQNGGEEIDADLRETDRMLRLKRGSRR